MLWSFLVFIVLQLLNCRPGSSQADLSEGTKLRLVNGANRCQGKLEILYTGSWGTVGHNLWDLQDAAVVCRELGCGPAISAPGWPHFWKGSGHVVTSDVKCSGTESTLRECRSQEWALRDYSQSYDAGVICSAKTDSHELRLGGGGDRCSGRVEVLHGDQWGTLCDVHFGLEDASVACQHLQCGTVKKIPRVCTFGQGTGPVWKENYRCRGNESVLWECPITSDEEFKCSHRNDASVICSDESWSIRLTNGGSRCDGRVEIYHNGSWGRVENSLWKLKDAMVVCRQLGCGVALAAYNSSKYGESEGPVWVNNVQCVGNESHLRSCSSFTLNPFHNDSISVGVLCSEHKQLRLSDGGSPCAGRVEIYYNGTWSSICADSWDLAEAHVVCKQLDCGKALQVPIPASCGPGSDSVWLDDFNCSGNESFIWQCSTASWGRKDCTHKGDVRIMCSEHKELRLVNGKHRCEGRVEVFYNGTWGTVCSDALDPHDAKVICKQLQCGSFVSIEYDTQQFGEGSGPIWLDEMECNSHESTLWQCQSDPWGQHNCHHRKDAGVVCSGRKIRKERKHISKDCSRESDSTQNVRLIGGNTNCSGRVEILCNNNWGTVCDDSWDMTDANVVCRQLGCGSVLLAQGGAAFGQGEGDIWLKEVKCIGSETLLSDCPSASCTLSDCDHKEDASVICSGLDLSPNSSLSTPAGPENKATSVPVVSCITLGVLLTCELIALIVVIWRKTASKGAITGGWESTVGLYEAIYEDIENIPPGIKFAEFHGSVSASIDSRDQIEYYTNNSLGGTEPESGILTGNCTSNQDPEPSHKEGSEEQCSREPARKPSFVRVGSSDSVVLDFSNVDCDQISAEVQVMYVGKKKLDTGEEKEAHLRQVHETLKNYLPCKKLVPKVQQYPDEENE